MDRRDFLQCAAVLLGNASLHARATSFVPDENSQQIIVSDYVPAPATLFTKQQRNVVMAAAEVIIPRTDTPGATDAGVPQFIELMVQDWLNHEERKIFLTGLNGLASCAHELHGNSFDRLSATLQLSMLEALESEVASSSWYAKGNVRRAFVSDAPFICQLKELTIWGFFTSEVGVKQVLRYNPMPMNFDGYYPRKASDTAWAPFTFYR